MKAHWFGGLVAALALTSGATHVSAEGASTVKAKLSDSQPDSGKIRVQLTPAGEQQGVMPGDKGYFLRDGKKIASKANFEVLKIKSKEAHVMTAFTSLSELPSKPSSLEALITTSRRCAARGAKPSFAGAPQPVVLGQTPPHGFAFATVTSTAKATDSTYEITIDKGSDDGVMPSSSAYLVQPGLGTPHPYKVDIVWVTKSTAGGNVSGVVNGTVTKNDARKLGFEIATCTSSK